MGYLEVDILCIERGNEDRVCGHKMVGAVDLQLWEVEPLTVTFLSAHHLATLPRGLEYGGHCRYEVWLGGKRIGVIEAHRWRAAFEPAEEGEDEV